MEQSSDKEYLDIVDEAGRPTGRTVARDRAHLEGIRHRTAHVWIVRRGQEGWEVLLQKRSMLKESFPGLYDTSSAGHIPAGDEPLESALRELKEELGISAAPEHRDSVDISDLTLQASEVDGVDWFDLETVWNEIQPGESERFCPPREGVGTLREYLKLKE